MSSSISCEVEDRWLKLTEGIGEEIVQKWWGKIKTQYEEDHRKYHNLGHLKNMFIHLDDCSGLELSIPALSYAIFFHEYEYNPKLQDHENKSIENFLEFCEEADNPQLIEVKDTVKNLILETNTHSTQEHKSEDSFGNENVHYFLDFDLAMLGYEPEEYEDYSKKIREEYSFLNENMYKMLRSKVLKSFLKIPNIFATKVFRSKYEEKARINIQREIDSLEES